MNNIKEWHIWDFPGDIYVFIKNEVREEFFKKMYKKFGSQKDYAKFLNKDRVLIQQYHYARSWDNGKKHIKPLPLELLHKSMPFTNQELKLKIENNVEWLRCQKGKSSIKINLPIKESVQLYRVVAHVLGDGSASKNKVPYYCNTCKELREQFKEDLKYFGDIKTYDRKLTVPIVCFQKPLTDILSYILSISFINKEKVPERLFNANLEFKSVFLQALFDDEGTISTNLAISMKSKNIIKDIKNLLLNIDIKTGKIGLKPKTVKRFGGDNYTLSIISKSINKFKELIDFSHPEKHKNLEFRLKMIERNLINRTRPLDWTRNEILRLLSIKPMKTLRLCENLLLTVSGVYHHLKYLEDKGLIKRTGYKNKIIWELWSSPNTFVEGTIPLVINNSD